MSVYVAADIAVTTFERRGVGCTWHDRHVFALGEDGQWVFVGGGGNNGQDDLLADRPNVLPTYLSSEDWLLGALILDRLPWKAKAAVSTRHRDRPRPVDQYRRWP